MVRRAVDRRSLAGVIAVVVLGLAGQLARDANADAAWLLYAARELLGGAKLGVNVLENTPPMIFALKVPVVAIAGWIRMPLWDAWVLFVAGLALLNVAWVVLQLPDPIRRARWTPVLLVAVLFLVPGPNFGQREHVTLLLTLPYLAVAGRRFDKHAVSFRAAVVVGVLGGIGVGIKPHFVVFPVLLIGLQGLGLRWRTLRLPEHWALVGVGVAYVVVTVLVFPAYLAYAREYGPLYQHFLTIPLARRLWSYEGGAIPGLIAIGVYLALSGRLDERVHAIGRVLLIGTIGFYLVALLQGKGWGYHFLPADCLGLLLTGLCLLRGGVEYLAPLRRTYVWLGACSLGATVALSGLDAANALLFWGGRSRVTLLERVLSRTAPGSTMAVFSTNLASGFPLTMKAERHWAFRFPSLWPVAAFREKDLQGSGLIGAIPLDRRGPAERRFTATVLAELEQSNPVVIFVLRPDTTDYAWGGARRFDYRAYFGVEPAMRAFLEGRYGLIGSSFYYDVLWRTEVSGAPRDLLVPRSGTGITTIQSAHLLKLIRTAAALTGAGLGLLLTSRRRATG